jgi:K+/H+ antiporter YhaU regulatory subunit KhtT
MKQADLEQIGKMLTSLQEQVAEFRGLSADFPSLQRNAIRVEASLNMMATALGRSVLEKQ